MCDWHRKPCTTSGTRYQDGDLDRALYDKQRPGATELLDQKPEAADHCHGLQRSTGRARSMAVRLVAEEVIKRKLVPKVGRETIRVLLLHHDLKPWREKNVVRGGTR